MNITFEEQQLIGIRHICVKSMGLEKRALNRWGM